MTQAKVDLGRQLFFDARLSADGSRSCYSCHRNESGNGGGRPLAVGAGDRQLTRHSPVIWNVGYLGALYWDGRSSSLEAQARAAWAGGNMGVGADNLESKAAEIAAIEGYRTAFSAVFPEAGVTPDTIVKSIAAYERTLTCNDTAWDRYSNGDSDALTEPQVRGLGLFQSDAGCAACHTPPHFSSAYLVPDGVYYNTGIGVQGVPREDVDVGRMAVTGRETD